MEQQRGCRTPSAFMSRTMALDGNILTGERTVQLSLDTVNCTYKKIDSPHLSMIMTDRSI